MAPYAYNPLKEARAVRFVRLLPGSAGGIQCQLFRGTLDDKTEYTALSYAWGSTRKNQSITCNGRPLPVTDNLLAALKRLRLPDEPRVFWIDAICINQDDVEERNRQVALMCEIYQRAAQLFIWLGGGDSYSTAGIKLMERFAAAQNELNTKGRLPYVHVKPDEWIAFAKLLQRPWFERLWIIQELAMGQQLSGDSGPLFLCGVYRFGVEDLKAACQWCNQLSNEIDENIPDATVVADIRSGIRRFLVLCEMTRHQYPEEVRQGLWRHWLLSKVAATREKKATDPRDRLFALYGFLREGNEQVAVADYSKSTAIVFQEFARDYIVKAKSLDVLSEVEEPSLRIFRHAPSWVPNWAIETSRIPMLRQIEMLGAAQSRKLDRQACGQLDPAIHLLRDDTILIDGVCCDEIAWVSDVLSADQLKHSQDSPSILLHLWKDVVRLLDPYRSGTPAIAAFYKTLICGREEEDRHAENFVAFWKSLHTTEDIDMATFCINTPEIIQLLCRRFAGAEAVAQMHDACSALEALQINPTNEMVTDAETFFTTLEMQTTMRGHDASSKATGKQFLRGANAQRYRDLLQETAQHRILFKTKLGYIGLGVEGARPDDIVTVLTGGKIPYILRRTTFGDRKYDHKAPKSLYSAHKRHSVAATLVGEAYVHGLMHGEAVKKERYVQWDRIALV